MATVTVIVATMAMVVATVVDLVEDAEEEEGTK